MSRRHQAYFSCLKFDFQRLIIDFQQPPRRAYALAKTAAAYYAFTMSTDHLTHITL